MAHAVPAASRTPADFAEPERREGGDGPRRASRSTSRARPIPHVARRARGRTPARGAASTSGCTSTAASSCSRFAALAPTPLEQAESLEQLRALEHGFRIRAVETDARLGRRRHAGGPRAGRAASWRPAPAALSAAMQNKDGTTGQVHLRDRRRGVVARQGPRRRLDRRAARRPRLPGHAAEVRPLHQRRPGHDEPVPARRGLRHRRRGRDRPRPRPLRALHRAP